MRRRGARRVTPAGRRAGVGGSGTSPSHLSGAAQMAPRPAEGLGVPGLDRVFGGLRLAAETREGAEGTGQEGWEG